MTNFLEANSSNESLRGRKLEADATSVELIDPSSRLSGMKD